MRIVLAHNFYQQPGGEDEVFAAEMQLLLDHGHEVTPFTVHNDAVELMPRLAAAARSLWNPSAAAELRALVRRCRAQVVHFHNTFPLISPACLWAARRAGAAVVMTLHNFRLLCPSATLFRDSKVCEECLGKRLALPGIRHACYRNSRLGSAAVAAISAGHRALGTWQRAVDLYIAPSPSARDKFVFAGWPPQQIVVKPHFVHPDPGIGRGGGGYAVFAGRLSPEKGLPVLLEAWRLMPHLLPLRIAGDGPLRPLVESAGNGIQWLGRLQRDRLTDLLASAQMLIFPSECYETFGRAAAEAFAVGTPVVASNHGAMADVVEDGVTGRLFTPGDADALAACVAELMGNPQRLAAMRIAARRRFEERYTGAANHDQLLSIYHRAMHRASGAKASSRAADAPHEAIDERLAVHHH